VTRQAARSPTGMRGQSMACSVVETVARLLPATAFARLRIDAPEPACYIYLLEANASKRPLARPQRLLSFENHRGEVSAPGLSLRRNSELFFRPVRPCAPTLARVRHAGGDVPHTKPVAVSRAQNFQTTIQLPLPFGTLILAGS
jgi:hypothetical protein